MTDGLIHDPEIEMSSCDRFMDGGWFLVDLVESYMIHYIEIQGHIRYIVVFILPESF
jgi:hypothetical protein